MWPDTLLSTGMFNSKLGLRLLHAWCRFVYRRATGIAVISPGMKNILVERGVPEEKIEVIYNWCDDALICRSGQNRALAESLGFAGKFNIVYAGNMGKAQALDAVIEAAGLLKSGFPNIQFVFIGSGVDVDRLKSLTQQKQLNNVLFIPRKPVSEIGPILCQADVLLVHLRKDPLFAITIPSKTQAYLASGRPVLMAVEGDAAGLVEKTGAGLSCEPENPESIASAVTKLATMSSAQLAQMGENGKQFYEREMSFQIAVDKFEILFQRCSRVRQQRDNIA
jgi:glycosyltransferase involved in cell wall biosynthesis